MARVIVLDPLSTEGLRQLQSAPEIEVDVRTGLAGEALREALSQFDGAVCRSGVRITADVLAGNRRLRVIVRAGVGTDNIDKAAATRQGIIVMNTPSGNTLSTAEHTFALMLGLSRSIAPAYWSLREGKWDRKSYMGSQLAGKTLGIIGLGRIGQEVASRALAFRMRVLGYDPFLSRDRAKDLGVEPVDCVDDLLPQVDYLTVHTPLTPDTENLIGLPQIEKMRPGVRLINCARGGIYNEQALVDGLKSGKLGGVALDVFTSEPCTQSPLFRMPGVLCTPHLGASTEEAQTQVAIEAAELLINFFRHGEVRHAVNMAAIDPKALESLRGYLDVAYRLGLLMAQCYQGSLSSCRLLYRGELATKDTQLLTSAYCAGLLEQALDEPVNIVNAQLLLKDRGIDLVAESHSDRSVFSASITAQLTTDQQTLAAGGTLLGTNMPRLILFQDYRLEAFLDGILLIFSHRDVPGIIGRVGTVLGQHQINIAQMAVGRSAPGSDAVGVLNLDSIPPSEAIQAVLEHPDIQRAHIVHLPPAGSPPPWL